MANTELLDRVVALSSLELIPRAELEWLVDRGHLEVWEPGHVVAPPGAPIEDLWIILSGSLSHHVDRGVGPRLVMKWVPGDVTGKLPYSRLKAASGFTRSDQRTEALGLPDRHIPEMIQRCPELTAHSVHLMLDRARRFSASELQDEKMISLGKLAAGLAHELNNPASAAVRGAKLLLEGLDKNEAASRALGGTGLSDDRIASIERVRIACADRPPDRVLSPIERADREDQIADWLQEHGLDPAHAEPLAETAMTIEGLEEIAVAASPEHLDAAIQWIATGCSTRSLAGDIERAANRIYELVAAVKRFTYMDNRAGPELVDVEGGLRDTVRVLASKARAKGASIEFDFEENLPPVHGIGGELNQVWMNLIDNAIDAIDESGKIAISAKKELDAVVVRVKDDGPGVPAELLDRIFDPFVTTKPPGQGTGLGLDITRRALSRHNGSISVASEPGKTEFRVALSIEGPKHARPEAPPG